MRSYRYVIVDVFTDRPLAGNQLAVFSNASGLSTDEMQALAREMNFSESTFVLPPEQGGDLRMRIFTPVREMPFAGHPTLGTAFAMAGPLQSPLLRIETGMGIVPVMLEREGAKLVFGRMEQPIPTFEPWADDDALLSALRVESSRLPIELYDNGVRHVYVMLPSFADVTAVRPDHQALEAAAGDAGVNVFAVEDGRVKTRMFMLESGIAEDPATGSAAGPLAVHLARWGVIPWGEEISDLAGRRDWSPEHAVRSGTR